MSSSNPRPVSTPLAASSKNPVEGTKKIEHVRRKSSSGGILGDNISLSRKLSNAKVFSSRKGLKNLSNEVDDFLPEDLMYERESASKSSDLKFFIHELANQYMKSNETRIVILLAAILSCIIYVVETYLRNGESDAFNIFTVIADIVIFIIFLIDYVFNVIFAAQKSVYILSLSGMIDFASLFAVANLFITTDLSFLPLFRLMRVIKIIRLFRTASIMNVERPTPPSATEAITFEIISLIVGMIVSIFLASAILFTITQEFEDAFIYSFDSSFNMKDDVTFFDCVYIVLEILSTLGFGDFIPGNTLGRFYVVSVLAIALTVIPMKVGQLIEIIGKKPRYLNEYVTGSDGKPHIVVYADLHPENFQRLVLLILSQGTNDPEVVEGESIVVCICVDYNKLCYFHNRRELTSILIYDAGADTDADAGNYKIMMVMITMIRMITMIIIIILLLLMITMCDVYIDAQPLALLSPAFPSPQLQLLLLHPINARKVQFFVGTVKSSSDLRRVKACAALAVFIFADSDIPEVRP